MVINSTKGKRDFTWIANNSPKINIFSSTSPLKLQILN